MRAAIQASGAKGQPLGEERNPSYSEAAKKNRLYPAQNPEAEILKSQIQAIQTEMSRFRTEIGKFKNLEKNVDELDNSVSQIKTSRSNLNKGQENSNYKLDSLIGMIQKLSGQPEAGADMKEDNEEDFTPVTRKEKSKIPTLTGAGLHDKNLKANLKRLQTGSNSAAATNNNKSC
jgi:chromosome segregation ATPase